MDNLFAAISARRAVQLVLLAIAMLGFGFSLQQSSNASALALTPRVYLPLQVQQYASQPPAPLSFGVSDTSVMALVRTPQALELARSAGVYWNRTSVIWQVIEPTNTTPDQYDWQSADSALLPLLKQGLQPFTLILYNPAWAANTDCGPVNDPNDLAEFIGALGARYPEVKYWALYNEVDMTTFSTYGISNGGCFGEYDINNNGVPDYADYAEMMRAASQALRAANPNAKLVFGLLAYDNFQADDAPPNYPGGCCFAYSFLDNLLAYMRDHPLPNGEQYADVLGFNNYRLYNDYYWEKYYAGDGLAAKSNALREKMRAYGFDFPLMVSELSSYATEPSYQGISQRAQARDVARMLTQGASAKLEQTIWWAFADYPNPCLDANAVAAQLPPAQRALQRAARGNTLFLGAPQAANTCEWWTMGIVDEKLKPKLAYYAYKTVIEQLRGWTPKGFKSQNGVSMFTFKQGTRTKHVYYVKAGGAKKVAVQAARVRMVDMFGKTTLKQGDGANAITVSVGADPLYVELNP